MNKEKNDKLELIKKQNDISKNFVRNNLIELNSIKTIAGVDLAYWEKDDIEYAVCCIVVLDNKSHEIIEKVDLMGEVDFPYIPGFLAFREVPLILEANKKLNCVPDLYMFDGNGYLHPRNMGIATHAGILLNKPSIGVAKSYFKIENENFEMPENELFKYKDIVIHNEVYGRVLRSQENVKPIFISVGNMIDLQTATTIVESMITKDSRIPLPIKIADAETRRMRKIIKGSLL